jgi:hypothetical protein
VIDHDRVPGADDRSRRTGKIRRQQHVVLGASIRALSPGRRGWISMSEAAALFSAKDVEYAFGEMDDDGNRNLASFAETTPMHRYNFMPVEGRLYFMSD